MMESSSGFKSESLFSSVLYRFKAGVPIFLTVRRHAKERFETLMKQQAEHNAWLQQASGVEVETTALMSIREDVYEQYMSSTLDMDSKSQAKADKEAARIQADNLGKTIRDVAMRRLSEKQYDCLASSPTPPNRESSASSTESTPAVTSSAGRGDPAKARKRRKVRHYSSDETGDEGPFLEQGRQFTDTLGEVMEVLRELQSQGRQLLEAALEKNRGN
ncbi:hypothetical protein V1506DRAFT_145132 [Lipomyces tetrasporus]